MRFFTLVMAILVAPSLVHAAAFCALRDPTPQIYELYPDATNYRSLVSIIDDSIRTSIMAELPFTLHNRELGKHTLYVALKEREPLGFVHVRSEASRWGLIEIAWSLDLDLNVRDMRFQRCRDPSCKALAKDKFTGMMANKNSIELRAMLTAAEADPASLGVSKKHRPLALTVLRSALKTIAVTRRAWEFDMSPAGTN